MTKKFNRYDLIYALDNAAEFLDNEEWPENDGGAQNAANKKAARMIRTLSNRVARAAGLGTIEQSRATQLPS